MPNAGSRSAIAGWYADPVGGPHGLRWWNGSAWTAVTATRRSLFTAINHGAPNVTPRIHQQAAEHQSHVAALPPTYSAAPIRPQPQPQPQHYQPQAQLQTQPQAQLQPQLQQPHYQPKPMGQAQVQAQAQTQAQPRPHYQPQPIGQPTQHLMGRAVPVGASTSQMAVQGTAASYRAGEPTTAPTWDPTVGTAFGVGAAMTGGTAFATTAVNQQSAYYWHQGPQASQQQATYHTPHHSETVTFTPAPLGVRPGGPGQPYTAYPDPQNGQPHHPQYQPTSQPTRPPEVKDFGRRDDPQEALAALRREHTPADPVGQRHQLDAAAVSDIWQPRWVGEDVNYTAGRERDMRDAWPDLPKVQGDWFWALAVALYAAVGFITAGLVGHGPLATTFDFLR